jgi:hypothetical protein
MTVQTGPESPEDKLDLRAWARRSTDPLVALGLAAAYVVALLATARSLGFSRDEGFYFSASSDYKRWFVLLLSSPSRALERSAIDGIWASNHEHPSLMKSLFALSHLFLHDRFKVFEDASTAFRFPGMLSMGLAIWLTYMFAARAYSRLAGVVSALALMTMPNVFYHAHLACFDVPIMAMWTACIYAYWRAEAGNATGPGIALTGPGMARPAGLNGAVLVGLVYGLTLETKHNAWMLPGVFLPHALLVHGRAMARSAGRSGRLPIPASLVAMATVGPAVFLALWPWLWNDTLPRIQEYVNFHLHHDYYNIEFLGRTYFAPPSPRSYMPVMIAATVPTVTLALFVVGTFDRVRAIVRRARHAFFPPKAANGVASPPGDRLHTDALVLLALVVPLSVFLLPRTPIFGGTKHWITAYPFLAILAGRGFDLAWKALEPLLASRLALAKDAARRLGVQAAFVSAAFLGPALVTAHSHPFGLSAYVPFFGGTAGGADLGLNRQFWGFTTQSLAPYFAEHAPPGATVYIMDTAWPSWARMVDEKRLRPDLRGVASPAEALFSIVHHEQHINEVDYNIWTEYDTAAPEHVLVHDGVPIVSVYERPPRKP